MQEEGFVAFLTDIVNLLFVFRGSEGGHHEGLGFSPGKHSRSVSPGEDPHFTMDWADLVEGTSVNPAALFNHDTPEDLPFQILETFSKKGTGRFVLLGNNPRDFLIDLPHTKLSLLFHWNQQGLSYQTIGLFLDPGNKIGIHLFNLNGPLLNPYALRKSLLNVNQGLEGLVAKENSVYHVILRSKIGPGLHHQDRPSASRHDQIDVTLHKLGLRWIGNELSVDPTYTCGGNRSIKGNIGQYERGRRTHDPHNGGVILLIEGKNRCNHLGLVFVSLREKRPYGSVD